MSRRDERRHEIEQALRRGPAHARAAPPRPSGGAAAASDEAPRGAPAAQQRIAARASPTSVTRRSTRPFGKLLLAASERACSGWPFRRRMRTPCSSASPTRVSPRIVEAPGRLDPIRRELDQYFEGRRARVRAAARLDAGRAVRPPRARGDGADPLRRACSRTREVAAEAGSPRGSRAAGNALGANPIPIVVPCHRVLRGSGALGGYAGGLTRKQFLLELEGAR